MGGSCWDYFTPFDSDVSKALRKLKEQDFKKNGKYYLVCTKEEKLQFLVKELLALEHTNPRTDIQESLFQEYLDHYRFLRSLPEPTTIKEGIRELLAVNRENGTHSILDIEGVSSEPGYGMAAPLTQIELTNLFGTIKPTREMIERQRDTLMNLRERMKATYIIVYENGEPELLYFAGCTGD